MMFRLRHNQDPGDAAARHQSRAAFVEKAEILLDAGRRPAALCAASLRRPKPSIVFLRGSKPALPPTPKLVRPSIPRCSNKANCGSCRRQARTPWRRPAKLHPSSKSTNAFARRVTDRPPTHRAPKQSTCGDPLRQGSGLESWLHRNSPSNEMQGISPASSMSSGISRFKCHLGNFHLGTQLSVRSASRGRRTTETDHEACSADA